MALCFKKQFPEARQIGSDTPTRINSNEIK
jgi:hypothetical protein